MNQTHSEQVKLSHAMAEAMIEAAGKVSGNIGDLDTYVVTRAIGALMRAWVETVVGSKAERLEFFDLWYEAVRAEIAIEESVQ